MISAMYSSRDDKAFKVWLPNLTIRDSPFRNDNSIFKQNNEDAII